MISSFVIITLGFKCNYSEVKLRVPLYGTVGQLKIVFYILIYSLSVHMLYFVKQIMSSKRFSDFYTTILL